MSSMVPVPGAQGKYVEVAVSSVAVTLGADAAAAELQAKGYDVVTIYVDTDAVRYRLDGTAPTATVGMPLAVGDRLILSGRGRIAAAKFIRQTTDAVLRCEFEPNER